METRNELLRELVIALGIVAMLLAGVGGLYWMRPGAEEATAGTAVAITKAVVTAPAPVEAPVVHADVYFDFKSARLRAEAAKLLQDKAMAMTRDQTWVVLVHGYADAQGPAEYNRRLAQRRAETVKQFLVELGVAETSIKVITVGPEGVLCDDPGKGCQQLNRRVHLEIRRLGPVAAASVPAVTADHDQIQKP
jgi:peptidoglycan-associated lipoprotein